jgi:hypothetical protein
MNRSEFGNTECRSRPQRRLHEIATLHRSLPGSWKFAPVEARAEAKSSAPTVVAE